VEETFEGQPEFSVGTKCYKIPNQL
jgi:hypothetical protein